jgi:hypothetical protein
MIIANLNENLTTDLILKNAIVESTILKSGYDYDDCCCGESCSCGKGHNRIELTDKMTTTESDGVDTNI